MNFLIMLVIMMSTIIIILRHRHLQIIVLVKHQIRNPQKIVSFNVLIVLIPIKK